jgi:hypothetical protein
MVMPLLPRGPHWSRRPHIVTALIGLFAIVGFICSCGSDRTAGLDQLPSKSASSASGVPTPAATAKSETDKPKPSTERRVKPHGSSAKFKHFKVTVREVKKETSSEVRVLAEVCVRRLPPDPQGNRTRISWDPWSVRAGSQTVDADPSRSVFKGTFPPDKTYRVTECASGWIPFFVRATVTEVKYANGVGDIAVWNAKHLDRAPQMRSERRASVHRNPRDEEGRSLDGDYANCTELRADYPHGVGLPGAHDRTRSGSKPVTTFKTSTRLYRTNADKDRDGDGIACEKL